MRLPIDRMAFIQMVMAGEALALCALYQAVDTNRPVAHGASMHLISAFLTVGTFTLHTLWG
jgi:hypothetical protein